MMPEPKVIYAGSFDVMHRGHIDIILRATGLFPNREIVVIIADNDKKTHMFTAEERFKIVKSSLGHIRATAVQYGGIISDYAQDNGCDVIIRGLRNGKDLEYETEIEQITRTTSCLETVYLTPYTAHMNTSSSLIRTLINIGKADKAIEYMNVSGHNIMMSIIRSRTTMY